MLVMCRVCVGQVFRLCLGGYAPLSLCLASALSEAHEPVLMQIRISAASNSVLDLHPCCNATVEGGATVRPTQPRISETGGIESKGTRHAQDILRRTPLYMDGCREACLEAVAGLHRPSDRSRNCASVPSSDASYNRQASERGKPPRGQSAIETPTLTSDARLCVRLHN